MEFLDLPLVGSLRSPYLRFFASHLFGALGVFACGVGVVVACLHDAQLSLHGEHLLFEDVLALLRR